MKRVPCQGRSRWVRGFLLAWCMLAFPGAEAWGQGLGLGGGSEEEEEAALEAHLDIEALLHTPRIFSGDIEDPVWRFSLSSARRPLQLPIRFELTGNAEAEVRSSTVRVDGGRFLAWRLVVPGDEASGGGEASPGGEGEGEGRASLRRALPEGTPWVSRKFELRPDGTVTWDLERFFPNAESGGQSLYALKLDPRRRQSLRPESPGRVTRKRGEDARAYNERRQAVYSEYRSAMAEYRELSSKVRDLPTTFEGPLPERVWGVYEVTEYQEAMAIEPAGLPAWSIPFELLEEVRHAVASAREGKASSGEQAELPDHVSSWLPRLASRIASDPHPWNLRLAAHAIVDGGLVRMARPGDVLYQLMQRLVRSEDEVARRKMVTGLIRTIPPTTASSALLKQASQNLDPKLQVMSLRGLLGGESLDRSRQQEAINTANRMLSDPSGPPPDLIIEELVRSVPMDQEGGSGSLIFIHGIRFEALPDSRLEEAVVAVLEQAGAGALLAIGWLNHRLLGSAEQKIVRLTLEGLVEADTGQTRFRPVVEGVMGLLFGPPVEEGRGQGARRAHLAHALPLESPRHSIFSVLQSGDTEIQKLAWQVLPRFEIQDADASGEAERRAIYEQLVDAGLGLSPTPIELVEFLAHQPAGVPKTRALVRVVVRGSTPASRRASQVLLGSGLPVTDPLIEMAYGERHTFGHRLYENLRGRVPAVVGLLRQRTDDPHATYWFAEQVAAGALPESRQWQEAYPTEDMLLELFGSSDQRLAEAAVAALVREAGGSEQEAREIADRMRSLGRGTIEVYREAWGEARKGVFLRRMERLAGPFRLKIALDAPKDELAKARAGAKPVGILELRVEGEAIRFGGQNIALSIPDRRFAIRIEKPSELKNLEHEALADLPLEGISGTVDLVYEPVTALFMGRVRLPDGQSLTLWLEPAGG